MVLNKKLIKTGNYIPDKKRRTRPRTAVFSGRCPTAV